MDMNNVKQLIQNMQVIMLEHCMFYYILFCQIISIQEYMYMAVNEHTLLVPSCLGLVVCTQVESTFRGLKK